MRNPLTLPPPPILERALNSPLRFWELQFSKSHMTSDVVYVPINSSLQFWELQFSKSHTTSDV